MLHVQGTSSWAASGAPTAVIQTPASAPSTASPAAAARASSASVSGTRASVQADSGTVEAWTPKPSASRASSSVTCVGVRTATIPGASSAVGPALDGGGPCSIETSWCVPSVQYRTTTTGHVALDASLDTARRNTSPVTPGTSKVGTVVSRTPSTSTSGVVPGGVTPKATASCSRTQTAAPSVGGAV